MDYENTNANTNTNWQQNNIPPMEYQQINQAAANMPPQTATHDIPKCTCCGHIGPWKVEPVFRPMDYILTILFLLFGIIPGIIYATIIIVARSGKHGDSLRTKYCTNCGGKNLFTFIY